MGCYLTNKALMLSYLMVLIMLHHLTILNNVSIYLSLTLHIPLIMTTLNLDYKMTYFHFT
jgi:hypothetical protein